MPKVGAICFGSKTLSSVAAKSFPENQWALVKVSLAASTSITCFWVMLACTSCPTVLTTHMMQHTKPCILLEIKTKQNINSNITGRDILYGGLISLKDCMNYFYCRHSK